MRSYNGFVALIEASNSMADRLVGMVKPRPPSLGGKDKSSHSRSPGGALPGRDGVRFDLIMSSIQEQVRVRAVKLGKG